MSSENQSTGLGNNWTVFGMSVSERAWAEEADGAISPDAAVSSDEVQAALNQVNDSLNRIEAGTYFDHSNLQWQQEQVDRLQAQQAFYQGLLQTSPSSFSVDQFSADPKPGLVPTGPVGASASAQANVNQPTAAPVNTAPVLTPAASTAPTQAPVEEVPVDTTAADAQNAASDNDAADAKADDTPDAPKNTAPVLTPAASTAPAEAAGKQPHHDNATSDAASSKTSADQAASQSSLDGAADSQSALTAAAMTGGGRDLVESLLGGDAARSSVDDTFGADDLAQALKRDGIPDKARAIFSQMLDDIKSGNIESELSARDLDKYSIAFDLWSASGGDLKDLNAGPADLREGLDALPESILASKVRDHIHGSLIDGVGDAEFNHGAGYGLGDVAKWVGDAIWRSVNQPGSRG